MSGLSVKAPRTRGTGRRVITVVGVVAAAITLAACSSASAPDDESAGTIGVVVYGSNTYNECWTTGALKALEDSGYEAKLLNSQFDPSKEISNFQSLIAEGVDGILTNPTSQESAARGALLASQQSIPTVNGLWFPPGNADDKYVGRVSLDDASGIEQTAEWVGANVEPTEVVLLFGVPGDGISEVWRDQITEAIEALPGGFVVVDSQPGMYDRTASQTATENMLTAHPDAGLVITAASEMAIGVSNYLQRSGKSDVDVIASDWSPELVELLESGQISADRYYSPAQQGELGIQTLLKSLDDGGEDQGTVDVPNRIVTADDIAAATDKIPACYDEYLDQAKAAQ